MSLSDWQPIETAPDDQWVLVFIRAEDEHMGRIHAARNRKVSNGHMWIVGHHFASDLAGKPTHWMPLPEPPASGMEARQGGNEVPCEARQPDGEAGMP